MRVVVVTVMRVQQMQLHSPRARACKYAARRHAARTHARTSSDHSLHKHTHARMHAARAARARTYVRVCPLALTRFVKDGLQLGVLLGADFFVGEGRLRSNAADGHVASQLTNCRLR